MTLIAQAAGLAPSLSAVVLACAGLLGFAAGLVAMVRRRGHR